MKRSILPCSLAAMVLMASSSAAAADERVCIRSNLIDHTDTPDDGTILFHMRNHQVWKNTLVGPCVGLRVNKEGFTYSPTSQGSDDLCSNLATIRLNDSGRFCQLGAFTPVEPH